jgi:uncharacterized protein (TIGR02246 family)
MTFARKMLLNMKSALSVLSIALLVSLTAARSSRAQSPVAKGDEAAVRQAGKDYLAAAERGDAKDLADFWTADGTYTDELGRTSKVRELLAHESGGGKIARPRTEVSDVKIRFLTPDVAEETGACETAAPAGAEPVKGAYSALWIHQSGRWKLESLRESRLEAAPGNGQLANLDVFIGQWTGETNKLKIEVSAKWNSTKTFLRRDFKISSAGKPVFNGTQEIGWDPATGHIRSWMFNDDGSYGEGIWSLEGTVWMVLSSRVLSDGQISKATHVYKFPDKNSMIWKSIRGSVDGQPADDFEIVLTRSSAAK